LIEPLRHFTAPTLRELRKWWRKPDAADTRRLILEVQRAREHLPSLLALAEELPELRGTHDYTTNNELNAPRRALLDSLRTEAERVGIETTPTPPPVLEQERMIRALLRPDGSPAQKPGSSPRSLRAAWPGNHALQAWSHPYTVTTILPNWPLFSR
jgi:hypothetical protein